MNKIQRIESLVESGMSVKNAIKKIKVSPGYYYKHRKQSKSVQHITLPIESKDNLIILIGNPVDIRFSLDRLVQLYNK